MNRDPARDGGAHQAVTSGFKMTPRLGAQTNLSLASVGRATLYRGAELRAVIDEHRTRQAEARTLSGLAHEIAHLRIALEAVADNVRRHEEQLRRLERQAGRKTS